MGLVGLPVKLIGLYRRGEVSSISRRRLTLAKTGARISASYSEFTPCGICSPAYSKCHRPDSIGSRHSASIITSAGHPVALEYLENLIAVRRSDSVTVKLVQRSSMEQSLKCSDMDLVIHAAKIRRATYLAS